MTFATLIDVVVHRAGDDDGRYRIRVRDWLNLVRSKIAGSHSWRSGIGPSQAITTSAATTSGIYGIGATNEGVIGDQMYDETSNAVLTFESYDALKAADPDKSVTGPPAYWADAGISSSGARQVYLWPIPAATYVIRFTSIKQVQDITEADEGLTVDPFFGTILPWAECFEAGLDYYYEKDTNEDANQILLKYQQFEKAISRRKASEGASATSARRLANVRNQASGAMTGRFPPAHYNNRGN